MESRRIKWFYHSREWQTIRDAVWSRDQGLCQDCLTKGIVRPGIDVHHIIELTMDNVHDPSIALNTDNLVTLCKDCHNERHDRRDRRFKVDANGHVSATE